MTIFVVVTPPVCLTMHYFIHRLLHRCLQAATVYFATDRTFCKWQLTKKRNTYSNVQQASLEYGRVEIQLSTAKVAWYSGIAMVATMRGQNKFVANVPPSQLTGSGPGHSRVLQWRLRFS